MKDKIYFTFTPSSTNSYFYNMFMRSKAWNKPSWYGVDRCAGHGNIRGEIIKRNGNVVYVRFKTIEINSEQVIYDC